MILKSCITFDIYPLTQITFRNMLLVICIFWYFHFDIELLDERDFKDHMMELCEIQKQREKVEKAYYEMKATKEVVENTSKEQVEKEARVKQQAVGDATKITEVLVDLTIYGAL